jgi:hypothetical protein
MAARTFDPQPIYMNVLPTATEWAVDGRIPQDGVTCFLGKPGSGKTFATIDAACCMATGLDCWGQKVGPPQKVIYIAAEAGPGVQLRIMAWILSHLDALKAAGVEFVLDADGRPSHLPNLLLWPKAVNLRPGTAAVAAAIKEIEASGLSADVLCVDTLFASSIGARLTLPEELLPIIVELAKLADALKVKTCLLVHHTTKSGEDYFGTVAFLATISALILFEAKESDKTAVKVSCERIREGEAFDPFEIQFQKVTVKTKPDKFGREEQVTLAVMPGTAPAAAKRPNKKDEEVDFMEMVLALQLGNNATYTQWLEQIIKVTPQKKDKRTGEMKPGISERTFNRNLAMIVERGHTILPTSQGGTYSIIGGPWGSGLQPGAGVSGPGPSVSGMDVVPAKTTANCHPYKGVAVVGSSFADGDHCQTAAKPLPNENGSGSSQGSGEGDDSPAEELARMMQQLG